MTLIIFHGPSSNFGIRISKAQERRSGFGDVGLVCHELTRPVGKIQTSARPPGKEVTVGCEVWRTLPKQGRLGLLRH